MVSKPSEKKSKKNRETESCSEIIEQNDAIVEYTETLYSKGHIPVNEEAHSDLKTKNWHRKQWEPSSTIEKKVDNLEKRKRTSETKYTSIDKKVDGLFRRKHRIVKEHTPEPPEGYKRVYHKKTGLTYLKKETE